MQLSPKCLMISASSREVALGALHQELVMPFTSPMRRSGESVPQELASSRNAQSVLDSPACMMQARRSASRQIGIFGNYLPLTFVSILVPSKVVRH